MQASNRRRLAAAYRISFGLLALAAIVIQFLTGQAHPPFSAVNFFSYFTTLSNLLSAIVFLWAGISARRTMGVELMRGAVTLYLSVVFIVYALLLSDIPLGILRPWINTVLHQVVPAAALFDWLCAPPEHRLELRRTAIWLAFPCLFLAYSLVRGARIDWYPYPFFDPSKVGGYTGVAGYCVAVTMVLVLFGALLTWLGNYLRQRRMPMAS